MCAPEHQKAYHFSSRQGDHGGLSKMISEFTVICCSDHDDGVMAKSSCGNHHSFPDDPDKNGMLFGKIGSKSRFFVLPTSCCWNPRSADHTTGWEQQCCAHNGDWQTMVTGEFRIGSFYKEFWVCEDMTNVIHTYQLPGNNLLCAYIVGQVWESPI